MSWLSDFLHPKKAYSSAQGQLDKYYNQAQGYSQPFYDALSDPQALQDKWSKGYTESDIAKQDEAMGAQHGLDAASSMGLMGSSPALQAIQSGTAGIVAGDRQKYLDDMMQKYIAAAGIGQNMGQNAMNMGQNSAQMEFNKNNAQGDMFGKLLGYGTGMVGSALGGPMGDGLAKKMGWSTQGNYKPAGIQ
jgi:hypothetical protein